MYYGSYANDYYNEYNEKKELFITILKIFIILFLIVIVSVGYFFIKNSDFGYINSKKNIVIKEQISKNISLDQKDINKIVFLVLKHIKEDKNIINDSRYEDILSQYTTDNLQEERLNITKVDAQTLAQKESQTNIYNKVVIEPKYSSNDSISKLSMELSSIKSDNLDNSEYNQNIKKELNTRQNEMRTIVVKEGDNLSKISYRAYGDPKAYTKILKANPKLAKNPNVIFVGERLRVPLF